MNRWKKIRDLINAEFPSFAIDTIAKIGQGEDNDAYLINDTFVFRFPKRDGVKQNLSTEIAVLPRLAPRLNLQIPEFTFVSPKKMFAGYRKMEGRFLTKRLYHALDATGRVEIQRSLAMFLTLLHETDLKSLSGTGITVMNYRKTYRHCLLDTETHIYPHLTAKQRAFITARFRSYLDHPSNFNYPPVVLHNDFSCNHMLIDPFTRKLSGIIDFGDIAIGDPDYDLRYLLEELGEVFLRNFLQYYKRPDQKSLFEKLYFFGLSDILQSIIESIKRDGIVEPGFTIATLYKYLEMFETKMEEAGRSHNSAGAP